MQTCQVCNSLLSERQIRRKQVKCDKEACSPEKYQKIEKVACEVCGKPSINKRFCSRECGGVVTAQRNKSIVRIKKKPEERKREKAIAARSEGKVCGWKFCNNRITNKSTYCNYRCKCLVDREAKMLDWFNGDTSIVANYEGKLHDWAILFLKELSDYSCQKCGWRKFHPSDGKPGVEIDHINGNPCDNRPENLRILCLNCHWETPTYRSRNKSFDSGSV